MPNTTATISQGMSTFQKSSNASAGAPDLAEYERRAEQADRLIAQLTERLGQLEAALAGGAAPAAAPAAAAGVAWPQNDHKKWQAETVKEKAKAEAPKKENKKKENKKEEKKEEKKKEEKKRPRVKVAKSDVYIDVMPDTEVDPFSWDDIKNTIKALRINGLLWAPDFALVDFVFGLKKMLVVCQIVDNMVESTAPIVEEIKKIKGVSEADMVSIQTASDDWDPENKLCMIAGAPVPAAAKGGDKKKGGKKDKKKKGKEEGPRVVTDDMIKQSAQKVIVAAKEAEFFVAGVVECDGSGQTDVDKANLLKVDAIVREKVPDCCLMYIAAGNTSVNVLVTVPASKKDKVNAKEFINSTLVPADDSQSDAVVAYGSYKCDAEKGDFAIKIKDQVNGMAFQYLRSSGLLVEDDSDDDQFFLSDL